MIHPVIFTTAALKLEFDNACHGQSSQGNMKKTAGFDLSISSAEITDFSEAVIDPSGFRISFRLLVRKIGAGRTKSKWQMLEEHFFAAGTNASRILDISTVFSAHS